MDSHSSSAASLYHLARLNCRERILVDPLRWTHLHLDLLQCFFDEPSPVPQTTVHRGDGSAIPHIQRLISSRSPAVRNDAIQKILAPSEASPLVANHGLYFSFRGRRVSSLSCVTFSPRGGAGVAPVAAYIDRRHIDSQRERLLLRPAWFKWPNKPCQALLQLQLRKITPREPLCDPYVMALLIALAQEQRAVQQTSSSGDAAATLKPSLLFTDDDSENIHLFTADIPPSFLARFDSPALPYSAPRSISIQRITVPLQPYGSFQDRLLALIQPTPPSPEKKRKREGDDESIQRPFWLYTATSLYQSHDPPRRPLPIPEYYY